MVIKQVTRSTFMLQHTPLFADMVNTVARATRGVEGHTMLDVKAGPNTERRER
jgi:hypothetical protein